DYFCQSYDSSLTTVLF
nr:immunoglobulin light chain junction region [Macaca mulatta]